MSDPAQSKREAKEHARAIEKAAEFFAAIAKRGELPLTPEEFKTHVEAFFARLEDTQAVGNALALAALQDQPCPITLFKPWCSYAQARLWSKLPNDPLPVQILNGKFMIKPSDFFVALHRHGRAKQ